MTTPNFAFDRLAADYDTQFTHSQIGRLMRQAIWQRLDAHFCRGQRVLELNCGTGEDAIYLGQRGVHVLATDVSHDMVAITRRKVATASLDSTIDVQPLAIEHLDDLTGGPFDGALSNFGGLNCVANLAAVAHSLALQLRPGARVFLCVMGPLVPWEWGWFLCHGNPKAALRRLRPGGTAWRGLTIRYPSIHTLQHAFAPTFRPQRTSAVGALLPPPYTEDWMAKHPHLLHRLNRWERRWETWGPLPWLADHYLLELERL